MLSIKFTAKDNINKLPSTIIKFKSQFVYRLINNFFSNFLEHIEIFSFILIERRNKSSEPINSMFNFFSSISSQGAL